MIKISNSEIDKWKRCRRQWLVTYGLGFLPDRETPAGTRQLGTRIHTAMEGWYGYQLDPLMVLTLIYQAEIQASPDWAEDLRKELDLALAMVEGYLEWTATDGVDADIEVVGAEAEITVPLPGLPEVSLTSKMDQVYRRISTGTLGFLDFKTGDLDKRELLALNPQFKTYSVIQLLASGHGVPVPGMQYRSDRPAVDGGIVRQLRRVKRATSRARPPFYQDDEFRYTPEQLSAHYLGLVTACSDIAVARDQLAGILGRMSDQQDTAELNQWSRARMPPTPMLKDCSWSCPHVELCPMLDDGSDWIGVLMRSGHYRQGDPYEYYRRDGLQGIRGLLTAGSVDPEPKGTI